MPPVPIYSSSPINAAKPSGITPKTAADSQANPADPQLSSGPTPTTKQAYTPAQPGATPALPVQTGMPQASASPQPTRTYQPSAGPPAPQPGAAPSAPATTLPPPPKAGETYHPPEQTPAPQTMPMPPQMSMPAPTPSYASYQGTTSTAAQPNTSRPVMLGGTSGDLSHPPGYQQNQHSDQLTSQQRHQASLAEGRTYDGEDEGVWDQAKKWATGVGDSLAAAEHEVWKRINKQ